MSDSNPQKAAFDVWNQRGVPLTEVERFIHDNHPMDGLVERGEGLVGLMAGHFPWSLPKPGSIVMEIGSGVGYLLQAALKRFEPSRIIGLDVADGMIHQARKRLARDGITDPRVEFLHYDGITIPLPDNSIDFIYSMACLQHVPRIYIYSLFREIQRVLKPEGYCSAQIMAFSHLRLLSKEERMAEFQGQVKGQLLNNNHAWMTYYTFEELLDVLSDGYDLKDIHIVEKDGSLGFRSPRTAPPPSTIHGSPTCAMK